MKFLKKAIRFAKKNPEIALAAVSVILPGVTRKVNKKLGPIIAAVDKD